MVTVTLRFYEELNDRLAPALRRREFERACPPGATARQTIEAFGIGLDEVELILINGESAAFDRVLREGDRIAVYPVFEAFDVTPLLCVRGAPLRVTRFITSAQLGALARLLRMARSPALRPASGVSCSRASPRCSLAPTSRAASCCIAKRQRCNCERLSNGST
jgi:hypothetical protein